MTRPSVASFVAILPFLVTCANDADSTNDQRPSVVEVALERGKAVNVLIQAKSNASCVVSGQGVDAVAPIVYSDSDGIVRLSLMATADLNNASFDDVFLTCEDDRREATKHRLRFRRQNISDPSMLPLTSTIGTVAETDKLRPGLSGNLQLLSDRQIAELGYPPRPKASISAAYQKWQEVVSRDSYIVDARLVETHAFGSLFQAPPPVQPIGASSNATSSNWSGFVINQPGLTYDIVQSEWNVPTVVPPPGGVAGPQAELMAIWAGLDGPGTNDLIQNGTTSQANPLGHVNPIWLIGYGAWIEYLPASGVQLSNFPVSAGDLIYSESWAGDSTGLVNPSGGFGWFYIADITNGHAYQGKIAKPNGAAPFSGKTAEWIVERGPSIGGLFPFADYQVATMTNMLADANGSYTHDIGTDQSINYSIYSGTTLLSSVVQQGSQQARFTWHALQ